METSSRKMEALLGLIVLGVIALFIWLSFVVGGGVPKNASRYHLVFDSALGLAEDNTVAVAGVKVGVVESIGIQGREALVTIAIKPEVRLHTDAKAAVRAKTLLGEKYVDLDPGADPAAMLTTGSTLKQNIPTVEIDQVIREMARLVQSLNVIAPPFETAVARLDTLLKDTDGEQLTTELTQTLQDASALIRETSTLVRGSSDDVRYLLKLSRKKGPDILERFEHAGARLDAVLAALDPNDVKQVSARLNPTMDEVEAIMKDMRVAMQDLKRASGRVEKILVKVDRGLTRTEAINERAIREFLQVEGVRVNLIPDAKVERRVRRLRNESTPLPVP